MGENITANQIGKHTSAPSPAQGFEVLLITGMSGAGRSHAANSVEDMGWYVVDNMPPKLLVPLVDMMTSSGSDIHKLAAVIDVRSRDYFDDLSAVLSHLDDLGVRTRILFLDASNEVLIKRPRNSMKDYLVQVRPPFPYIFSVSDSSTAFRLTPILWPMSDSCLIRSGYRNYAR